MSVRTWPVIAALLAASVTGGACLGSASQTTSQEENAGARAFSTELAFCVDRMNALRATKALPPLARNETLERYAAEAARADGLAHAAHRHARQTNLGAGTAHAENEILWWSLDGFGSVHAIIEGALAEMWKEGAGGTHYDNMVGPFTQAGCGIFVHGDEVTVVQALR